MVNGIFKTENLNSSIDKKRAPKSSNKLYGTPGYDKEFLIRDGVDVGRVPNLAYETLEHSRERRAGSQVKKPNLQMNKNAAMFKGDFYD